MRISDWSSDVCSSDLPIAFFVHKETGELHPRTVELMEQIAQRIEQHGIEAWQSLDPAELLGDEAAHYEKDRDTLDVWFDSGTTHATVLGGQRSEEHTSELQSLMRISYAVFCLKNKNYT